MRYFGIAVPSSKPPRRLPPRGGFVLCHSLLVFFSCFGAVFFAASTSSCFSASPFVFKLLLVQTNGIVLKSRTFQLIVVVSSGSEEGDKAFFTQGVGLMFGAFAFLGLVFFPYDSRCLLYQPLLESQNIEILLNYGYFGCLIIHSLWLLFLSLC